MCDSLGSEIVAEETVAVAVEETLGSSRACSDTLKVSSCPALFVENKKWARDGDVLEPLLAVSDQEQRLIPDVEQSVYIDLESQTWIKEDPVPLVATQTHSSTFFFCLRIGWRWIVIILRLALYGLLLLPGFVQVGYNYYCSKSVHRNIICGDNWRNRLDLYLPEKIDEPKPVVIFVPGGAWIIGHRAWGSLLGQQLAAHDIIVASLDYRNFPQGTAGDMISDICTGITYVHNNIASFGGDPDKLFLVGQSAGAHLSTCALVWQAVKESEEDGPVLPWKPSQFKAFMGISGGYNLPKLIDHFDQRGLYKSLFLRIMEGKDSLLHFSPEAVVLSSVFRQVATQLPPITLFHGTADYSIPCDASVTFAESLQSIGVDVNTHLYNDKTHTDLILQDPMRGNYEMLDDMLAVLHADDEDAKRNDATTTPCRRLVPLLLLNLARKISPF
ncbi:unnamed protein product [Sphagnum compactum]